MLFQCVSGAVLQWGVAPGPVWVQSGWDNWLNVERSLLLLFAGGAGTIIEVLILGKSAYPFYQLLGPMLGAGYTWKGHGYDW